MLLPAHLDNFEILLFEGRVCYAAQFHSVHWANPFVSDFHLTKDAFHFLLSMLAA